MLGSTSPRSTDSSIISNPSTLNFESRGCDTWAFGVQGGIGPDTTRINVSHVIHHVAFGESFPGQANPLDGFHRNVDVDSGTFKYFLKLVPTTYISPGGARFIHPIRSRALG